MKTNILIGLLLVILGVGVGLLAENNVLGSGTAINNPQFTVASSTKYAVTTSVQVLATSSRRVAATIQASCPSNTAIHLNANNDAPATVSTGPIAFASTTLALASFPELPVLTGAVQAISSGGSCSVVVTEWLR